MKPTETNKTLQDLREEYQNAFNALADIKKQLEEKEELEKQIAEKVKAEEKEKRYNELVAVIEKTVELYNAYLKDYGSISYSGDNGWGFCSTATSEELNPCNLLRALADFF